jgi:hypothetical protein
MNSGVVFGSKNSDMIKQYSKIYENNISKYEKTFFSKKQSSCIEYIRILKKTQKELQDAGNLDGWGAVNKELTRFRNEPVVKEKVKSPANLRAIQDAYCAHLDKLEQNKHAQIISLKKKYIAKLTALQKEWTRSGNFNDAYVAKAEIKRVNESDKIKKSEAALAKCNSEKTSPDSSKSSSSAEDSPEDAAPEKATVLSDGSIVHPPATTPRYQGKTYKPAALSRTPLSPWPTPISAKIYIASETDGAKNSRITDTRNIKIVLKAAKSGDIKTDLSLIVQYYVKSVSGSSSPRLDTTKNIKVPFLDKRSVVIEVAPVSVTFYKSEHSAYGDKFYGYIVSVVDSDNNLIYQASTKSVLSNIAKVPDKDECKTGGCH